MAKNLFHSALVAMGEVTVTVKSHPAKSKFPNKPDYCYLIINGEEFSYSCENQECATFFKQCDIGRTMVIEAKGTREEAFLNYVGEAQAQSEAPPTAATTRRAPPPPAGAHASAPAPHSRPPANPPPPAQTQAPAPAPKKPAAPPPPHKPTEEEERGAVAKTRKAAAQLANVYKIAWTAGMAAKESIQGQRGETMNESQLQGMISTVFIQLLKEGVHFGMPVKEIAIGKPPAPIHGDLGGTPPADTGEADDLPM